MSSQQVTDEKTTERRHAPTQGLYGWITHTELISRDPAATKAWCASVLGWNFMPSFSTPEGEYHLFAYAEKGGGGIRATRSQEAPGSVPTVHVADADAAHAAAVKAGATTITPPTTLMPGVRVALVKAPGGVLIGFSGPSERN